MKKVMIVDNDKEFLEEMDDLLRSAGYKTVALEESGSVVREALKEAPDIILLDLKMDMVSGFTVADVLSKTPGTSDIPIVGITGVYTERSHRQLMREVGIKECLTKPVNPGVIFELIESLTKPLRPAK
jgi:CheY-like chemotaxis protein